EFQRITGEYPAYRPGGCQTCDYTGFRGRLPVIESLEMSPALRQAIVSGERRLGELARVAGGYRRSMAASAKDWLVSGQTTPGEVQHVLGLGFWRELAVEHGVNPESLSANLGQESQPGSRMKVLILSRDAALCASLAEGLSYGIERVNDDEAATSYLKQNSDVIGLVVDAQLAEGSLEAWLTRLRTNLAWAGLPALFVTRPQDTELKNLLTKFDAPNVELDEDQPQILQDALTHLLQGKR
ncbi:MAG: type II/IV secretion system protein, partial [Pseudomonadota bacterium]